MLQWWPEGEGCGDTSQSSAEVSLGIMYHSHHSRWQWWHLNMSFVSLQVSIKNCLESGHPLMSFICGSSSISCSLSSKKTHFKMQPKPDSTETYVSALALYKSLGWQWVTIDSSTCSLKFLLETRRTDLLPWEICTFWKTSVFVILMLCFSEFKLGLLSPFVLKVFFF